MSTAGVVLVAMPLRYRPTPVPKTPALLSASIVATLAASGCGNDDENGDSGADATIAPMPGPGSDTAPMPGPTTDETASDTGTTSDDSVTDPTIAPMPGPGTTTEDSVSDTTADSTGTDGTDGSTESTTTDGSTTAIPPMPPPMNDPIEPDGDVR
jgi:hypothetical protein